MTAEEKKQKQKEYYEANKERILAQRKIYKENNKDSIKEYYLENKEIIKEKQKIYYQNNKESIKEYYQNNKDKFKKYSKEYQKNKRQTNLLFKLKTDIRNNIRKTLNNSGVKKLTRTEQILGCTFEEFKLYIESRFENWMTWENKGNWDGIPTELNTAWDIDHIIPLSSATNEIELLKLCHYSNLQPLCSYTNRVIKRNNPTD
jgi:hypothetical protein